MRQYIDTQFPYFTKFDARNYDLNEDTEEGRLRKRFYDEQNFNNPNYYGIDLYMDMKSLVLEHSYPEMALYDNYNWDYFYPYEVIQKWVDCNSADFWYFLVHKWRDYDTTFHFAVIRKREEERILNLATKIDRKFAKRDFDNSLLGDIGSDFTQFYFPTLLRLTGYLIKGLPYSLKLLLTILIITIITGVIIPILISAINISFSWKEFFTYSSVLILILSLIYMILRFKKLLEGVVKYNL